MCLLLAAAAACGGDRGIEEAATGPEGPDSGGDAAAPPFSGADEPEQLLEPAPGPAFERELLASGVHAYRLPLDAGRYLELVAEQRGVDLLLVLFGPDGREVIRYDSPTGTEGEERLRAVTAAAGDHRLEVRAPDPAGASGVYALSIEESRPASPVDRERFEADLLFARAEALRRRGGSESHRAVPLYERALETYDRLGDRERQAEACQRLAWLYRKNLDEQARAVPYYRRAAALFAELGEVERQVSAVNNLGRVSFDLGEMEEAFAGWREAMELWRRSGDPAGEAAALNNLGLYYLAHGEAAEALDFFGEALDRLRHLEHPVALLRVLRNRGNFYRSMGKDREALDDLEESQEIARLLKDRRERASGLIAIGQVLGRMGESERAREALGRALDLERELGRRRGVAVALRELAAVEAGLGRNATARRSLERARDLFRELEAPRDEADAEARLGRLLLDVGRPAEALVLLERARALFAGLGDPDGEVSSLLGKARAERVLGRLEAARDHAVAGLARIEELRGDVGGRDLRSAYLARQQDHFDFLIDLLMELHRLEPDAGHDLEAFAVGERSRARSLLESLIASDVDLRQTVEPELLAREEELGRRMSALEIQRQELLLAESTPETTAAVERRLRRAIQDYYQARSRIRSRLAASPELPQPLSAGEVQRRVLDGETLLLEYDLGGERSYLWAVSAGSLAGHELPARSEIETAARFAHRLLAEGDRRRFQEQTGRALAALGEMLLGPVAADLGRHRRLLIVAEGALQYVPFAALTVPAGADGGGPLLARHEVVSMPSASALAALRRRLAGRRPAPGAAAVLADPVFGTDDPRLAGGVSDLRGSTSRRFPRLVHSRREAEAILSLLPPGEGLGAFGFEASRETVESGRLGRFRVLHFATHGELDAEHPELSRLTLSRFDETGRSRDGQLFAHEIHGLELPAELVVLSGCRTALGEEVRGEGLVGLPQAFFDAGAGRVLVSLWPVEDRATAELMAGFYRHLLEGGLAPASALRKTQLAIRDNERWSGPYHWAGWVLQGEWRWDEP